MIASGSGAEKELIIGTLPPDVPGVTAGGVGPAAGPLRVGWPEPGLTLVVQPNTARAPARVTAANEFIGVTLRIWPPEVNGKTSLLRATTVPSAGPDNSLIFLEIRADHILRRLLLWQVSRASARGRIGLVLPDQQAAQRPRA